MACFSTLAIDHDDDGITLDKYGPNRLGNFLSFSWILVFECRSYGWSDESTSRFHVPRHNMINPDKLKLVNYNHKMQKFSKCKILVGKFWQFNMHSSNSSDFSTIKVLCYTVYRRYVSKIKKHLKYMENLFWVYCVNI